MRSSDPQPKPSWERLDWDIGEGVKTMQTSAVIDGVVQTNMYKYLPKIVGPQLSCNWQTLQLRFQETLFSVDLHGSNLKSRRCFSHKETFQRWNLPSYAKLVILLYGE